MTGIDVNDDGTDAAMEVHISNCVIRMSYGGTPEAGYGITALNNFVGSNSDYISKIWNNIIYGYTGSTAYGGSIHAENNGTVYAYNNTCVGGNRGIVTLSDPDFIAKNNISIDATDPFYTNASFHADSTNNVSDTGDAPGSNPVNGEPTFVNKASNDYHLGSSDTVAQGAGADLDGDAILPVTDDIDGDGRDAFSPDIGADEYRAISATTLYRSVGITATDLNTGSLTVEISGSTATFSGDMPTNVGVGDVLAYNNGSNQIAFIHGRSSATVFTVKDKDGGTPSAAGTSVGVYRAYTYTSLSNWESQTENSTITEPTEDDVNPSTDLATANTIMMVACYGDGEDTTSANINSWTTGPDNYIKIYTPVSLSEVGASQRHNGAWDTSAYRISMVATYFAGIGIKERYVRIDGLQIESNMEVSGESNGIQVSDGNSDAAVEIHISNCIFRMTTDPLPADAAFGIGILTGFSGDNSLYVAKVWNNIIYGYAIAGGGGTCMYAENNNGTVYAYNNTCVGGSGAVSGFAIWDNVDFYVKNNISIDFTDPYNGTFNANSTNNVSDTGDAPGSNPVDGEPTFVNKAGNNYHLASSDTVAQGAGADLDGDANLPITDDIDGDSRDASTP
ncbi:MAG: hypothetical protein KAS40_07070, partial [Desulfobacterales bacterium]|nr:hypothetical protein [Desulfobacterales bacterium]